MSPELLRLVGLALVGGDLLAPADRTGSDSESVRSDECDPAPADWLAAHGWPAGRVAALRAERQAAGLPWPFTVDPELVRPVGFARFAAVLAQVRRDLGVDGLVPTQHHGPRVIGPAEQRLLSDVPPHHGPVG